VKTEHGAWAARGPPGTARAVGVGRGILYLEVFGPPEHDGSVCFCEFGLKMEVSSLALPYSKTPLF
jgi:hypothetical protein